MEHELIPIGKIVKCQGIRGQLRLFPFISDLALNECVGKEIYTIDSSGTALRRHPVFIKSHKKIWIILFEGIDNINVAQALIGQEVAVYKNFFPELSPGNYYWFEIVGLDVFDENKKFYGKVVKIFPTGSNDVYIVKNGLEEEFFLPATKEIVKKIDLKEKKIVFHLVDGLLEN